MVRELERQTEEWKKKLKDVEEEGRLGREELELRLKAASKSESRNKDIEAKLSKLNTDNKTLREQLESHQHQVAGLEDIKKSLDVSQAENSELGDKIKAIEADLRDRESQICQLEESVKDKETLSKTLEEKQAELSSCLGSMARMEDSVRGHQDKVEEAQQKLQGAQEEHRKSLETLRLQFQNSENQELNQLGILIEKHKLELDEKENLIKKLHSKSLSLEESTRELQDRLTYNLESSMKTEEELETKVKNLETELHSFNTSLPASIYNLDTRLLMNHQSLCLAVFLKPGKAIFSLITQHNNTNQIQPSLHPAETDNTEII